MSKKGGPPSALPKGNQGRWWPIVFTLNNKTGMQTRLDLELNQKELRLTSNQNQK
jgi:hypothetical protein